mmetsp:Transcript_19693/g.50172  ORF Transcript_19693/g.50172 Transcript_19693/m.50172 type:complete len:228 (+) Transcript_19693:262-945(+)
MHHPAIATKEQVRAALLGIISQRNCVHDRKARRADGTVSSGRLPLPVPQHARRVTLLGFGAVSGAGARKVKHRAHAARRAAYEESRSTGRGLGGLVAWHRVVSRRQREARSTERHRLDGASSHGTPKLFNRHVLLAARVNAKQRHAARGIPGDCEQGSCRDLLLEQRDAIARHPLTLRDVQGMKGIQPSSCIIVAGVLGVAIAVRTARVVGAAAVERPELRERLFTD